jgi:hypothetical protein
MARAKNNEKESKVEVRLLLLIKDYSKKGFLVIIKIKQAY